MERTIFGRSFEMTSKGPVLTPCAPHDMVSRLGDKWTVLVISLLSLTPTHRLRFSEIKNGVSGISQRMLTVTLRHLERDGLLIRHYFSEVPPRVEYGLTEMATGLLPALESFTEWLRTHWPAIEASRVQFDAGINSETGKDAAVKTRAR